MPSARTRAVPPEVGRLSPLAYTGSTYHLTTCPRVERASRACVTFAARAMTNRAPCPTCLPHGLRVVAEHDAA